MQTSTQEEKSITDIINMVIAGLKYLKRKWLIILLSTIIGGIIGYVYAYREPVSYTATMTFVVSEAKGTIGGAAGLASQLGIDLGSGGGSIFAGDNLIYLMQSRRMVEKTLLMPVSIDGQEISMAELFIRAMKMREKWKDNPKQYAISFPPTPDREHYTIEQNNTLNGIYGLLMSKHVSINQRDKKVNVIYLDVTSPDERFSKLFAEKLVKVASDFYVEAKTKRSFQSVTILQNQVDSIRTELNNAISGAASATDATFNLNTALNIKRVPTTRRQIDVQANIAILTQLVQNLEVAKMSFRQDTPLFQIIDSPIYPIPQNQLNRTRYFQLFSIAFFFLTIAVLLGVRWAKENITSINPKL